MSLPIPISFLVFPALSYTTFKVLGFILRFLINFESVLVQGKTPGSSFSCLHATFVEEAVLSPPYVFGDFIVFPKRISQHTY
jgi:hypothetical protein